MVSLESEYQSGDKIQEEHLIMLLMKKNINVTGFEKTRLPHTITNI